MDMSSMKHNLPGHHSHHRVPPQHAHDYEYSECDSQSWVMSDRPSVAGQSSHSGSHSGVMVNKKAKELRDIVHHQLRSDLKECRCESCLQVKYHEQYQRASSSTHSMNRNERDTYSSNARNGYHYPHSSHSNSYHHSNETMQDMNRYNTISSHRGSRSSHHRDAYEQQEIAPPPDNNKIYSWLEKNERYQQEGFSANPAPSPSIRRKKKPVTYNTSRNVGQPKHPLANDTGMPILPPPDADNVLQEVKRVLEEPQHSRSSRQPLSQQQHYNNNSNHHYEGYDKRSMVSAPWSTSDNSSIVSYNPSQISTVPSSASRLWNAQGYFDNGTDERHTPSEVRSQATSKHSGGHRSIPHRSDHHSDVRSQSTGLSHGSDGSKGRSKNRTCLLYTSPSPRDS